MTATSINLGLILEPGATKQRADFHRLWTNSGSITVKENEVKTIAQAAITNQFLTQVVIGLPT